MFLLIVSTLSLDIQHYPFYINFRWFLDHTQSHAQFLGYCSEYNNKREMFKEHDTLNFSCTLYFTSD